MRYHVNFDSPNVYVIVKLKSLFQLVQSSASSNWQIQISNWFVKFLSLFTKLITKASVMFQRVCLVLIVTVPLIIKIKLN